MISVIDDDWSDDVCPAETRSGAKKRVERVVDSNFKVELENGIGRKIRFLACDFFLTCSSLTSIVAFSFSFFDSFFENGFPIFLIALERSS